MPELVTNNQQPTTNNKGNPMIVGVPREIKTDEHRVALLPSGAKGLTRDGHTVLVERGAGVGSGFDDADYAAAGAELMDSADDLYARSELVVKVKEPQPAEYKRLRKGQVVFCFFHFAASRELTERCAGAGIAAVAYETLSDSQGRLPVLTPMSEIAGRMSVQEGAKCLERPAGGRGVLLGGVPGTAPGKVVVIGGGVVGSNAARVAAGMGATVRVLDLTLDRLRHLADIMPANVTTIYSGPGAIEQCLADADLVVGAVHVRGARCPVLIDRSTMAGMPGGAVFVDVAIDQGGCSETSRPTTHREPTYVAEGVVHYCVANIPGAVPRTSARALCNASLPYVRELAGLGLDGFLAVDAGHAASLNLRGGEIVNQAINRAFK